MPPGRTPFVVTWSLTVCLLLVSGLLEYRGYEFMTAAEALTAASAIGSLVLTVLGFWTFWRAQRKALMIAALGLACSPFVVGVILSFSGAEPNAHGIAIVGLLFHGLLCELTAVILVASCAVRAMLNRQMP